LQEVMKEAIFEKPAEHCFEQVSEMTEHNAMVRIGG
jgi:molybdenum cofactor biosynthesis protein A, bacterial